MRIARNFLIFAFFALAFLALIAPAMAQDWYADFLAGPSLWGDTQNSNEVEANSDPGAAFLASLGYQLGPYLSVDIEAAYRYNRTHGENGDDAQSKGDGDGHIGSGTLNLWPGYDITPKVRVYVGGGGGGGCARLRGETDCAPVAQGGAGLVIALTEALSAHLAYRALFMGDTEHDGLKASYDSHSVLFGLRVKL